MSDQNTTAAPVPEPEKPKVCPCCGYCPVCGRKNDPTPVPINPWPWVQPAITWWWNQPQWNSTPATTDREITITYGINTTQGA